ncbi:DUF2937 family protein [Thalassomonas viridans]|uniref:DUF2937 family protein n=1 Tax=Thalassomonas viridans TaxID=137584 RepID=A0AAF0C7A6_9GAMM|nr:DUF2937 family protein [Thalassomonas viridans]WDE02970.1 DUF2937 family protein [Thalassomonas viridans]
MPKMLATLIDRCLFTVFFILGLQVPEFMQQYTQRLSGHLHEAHYQLEQFQAIADNQFQGNLLALIKRYQSNNDDVFQQTGQMIENLMLRIEGFNQNLTNLQQGDYLNRLYYFITQLDSQLAAATLEQYQLAIPVDINALTTGVTFAIILLLLGSLFSFLIKGLIRRFSTNNQIITRGPLP